MAIIRKILPQGVRGYSTYVKFDTNVFIINGLSDGAKVMYAYMASMKNGRNFSDTFFIQGLGVSDKTYKRRKKELVDCGLIYVDRVGPKSYHLYIGYHKLPAVRVMEMWKEQEHADKEIITMNEMVKANEELKKEMGIKTKPIMVATRDNGEPEQDEPTETYTGENAFD